jgi:hypothetical protein
MYKKLLTEEFLFGSSQLELITGRHHQSFSSSERFMPTFINSNSCANLFGGHKSTVNKRNSHEKGGDVIIPHKRLC